MSGTLVMMVGIPGCGKSTYAKEVLLKANPTWKYVSRDEVRYEYVSDQEHYFDHETEVYKEFCNRLTMHLINGDTVIADATHINANSRRKLVNSLGVKPDKVYAVVMTTPFEICAQRNAAREGITRVPDTSMYRMKNSYRPPNLVGESYINSIVKVKGV